jgi:hypothetical protein
LTIVKSDPKWGLKAVFRDADRAILIERRVGLRRPDEVRTGSPQLGEFEEDVLVTDGNGRVIMLQQGGHELVDPTWKERFDESVKEPLDTAERTAELALLDRATEQLLAGPEALDAGARASFDSMRTVALRPIDSFRQESDSMSYGPGYNSLEIRYQRIYYGIGWHSATWSNINGGSYVTCNHGSCASSPDMWYSCTTWQKAWNADVRYCSTGYQWDSNWNHNCHDDTVLQLWSFQYGPQDTWGGVCNNGAIHWDPPSCGTGSW